MSEAKITTDHERIKRWVEERGGKPSAVKETGGKSDPGVLRIDYPGFTGEGYTGEESLREISWEEFFNKFEKQKLAFLYQEETESGAESRFSKLINRDGEETRSAKSS